MSPVFFSSTQDHALLALVINEANHSQTVGYLGRTALQKIVYFLKAAGVPTQYSFEIHHYGPFSDQLGSDVELLMADGIIENQAKTAKYWNYGPAPGGAIDSLLSKHEEFVAKHRPIVKAVVNALGPLDPQHLELFATLHYAYRYETATASHTSQEAVIARFKGYKGNKFSDGDLATAYETMVKANLIQVAEPTNP